MKRFLIIFILIFLTNCRSTKMISSSDYPYINPERSQQYKKDVDIMTTANELRRKHLDFIAYKSYSVGYIKLAEKDFNNCSDCTPDYPIYLIWNENNKRIIQKFDNCGSSFPLELNNSEIIDFVESNFDFIKLEKIKFYQSNKNSVYLIDHSTFKQFLISKSGIETYSYFDVYNLSTTAEKPNINYKYNNSLKIITLNSLIENQIKSLNSLDLFKRDLSTCKINSK